MNESTWFGRGVGFPLRLTQEGRLAWSEGEGNVRESIRLILLTAQGERLRRPTKRHAGQGSMLRTLVSGERPASQEAADLARAMTSDPSP